MADEKSIYERWSEERLDPPFPKEWGLDEEDEAELLWPIWPLLFMGESDTEQYVEIITDNVMDVLGLEYDGENEDSKLSSKGTTTLDELFHVVLYALFPELAVFVLPIIFQTKFWDSKKKGSWHSTICSTCPWIDA